MKIKTLLFTSALAAAMGLGFGIAETSADTGCAGACEEQKLECFSVCAESPSPAPCRRQCQDSYLNCVGECSA